MLLFFIFYVGTWCRWWWSSQSPPWAADSAPSVEKIQKFAERRKSKTMIKDWQGTISVSIDLHLVESKLISNYFKLYLNRADLSDLWSDSVSAWKNANFTSGFITQQVQASNHCGRQQLFCKWRNFWNFLNQWVMLLPLKNAAFNLWWLKEQSERAAEKFIYR